MNQHGEKTPKKQLHLLLLIYVDINNISLNLEDLFLIPFFSHKGQN